MKGSITILLVASIIITPVLFSNAYAEISIGFKGGLTASNYWGGDSDGQDFKADFVGGVFLTYLLNTQFLVFKNIAIQPEILYHSKGAKESTQLDETLEELWGITITETIDYIEIPILCKLEIPPSSNLTKGYLLIGPAFAYNIHSEYQMEFGAAYSEEDIDEALRLQEAYYISPRDIDIGFVVGLSADIAIGSIDLVVDLRHTLGLTSTVDNYTVRNQALSLMLGAALPFGRTD
jgi:hypothetical protein